MRLAIVIWLLLGIGFGSGSNQPASNASLRLLLSEVQAGTMASEHYCTLVFADRRFHAEKATRKMGKDRDRKVYEGELPEGDWDALAAILDRRELKDLNVPQAVSPLVIQDVHSYTISVARGTKFQNLEFLDNKSRRPYESQLRPLLDWWKSFRHAHTVVSEAPPDDRCALDSTHAVFSN
jgi:hypothetical protein